MKAQILILMFLVVMGVEAKTKVKAKTKKPVTKQEIVKKESGPCVTPTPDVKETIKKIEEKSDSLSLEGSTGCKLDEMPKTK